MHADELDVDVALVRSLLAQQFPHLAERPLEAVRFAGTDNAIYRLGEDLSVRLPRRERTVATLRKELEWLPRIARALPLRVPSPVYHGKPSPAFPFDWAIYTWVPGISASEASLRNVRDAARAIAAFVVALQSVDASGGPRPGLHNFGRGQPLAARDEQTRAWIRALEGRIDTPAVTAAWEAAVEADEWAGRPVWVHGDLDGRNILVEDDRVTGVVDFGCLGVGDPACDVMVAWKLLDADARVLYRHLLDVDDATWARARGWAVSQAVGALAYYTDDNNPLLVRDARQWLAAVLGDATPLKAGQTPRV
jgi:aminoglycoside phosphotransferase (APT) family kinase protein